MTEKLLKRYIFASDFDQTLTFNDSGYVLSEMLGIPTDEFERKAQGMAKLNLVQQGAELAYLLLHDPEFNSKARKEHLYEVGKQIRLKENIKLLSQILDSSVEGYHFDFYVISAAPVEFRPRRHRSERSHLRNEVRVRRKRPHRTLGARDRRIRKSRRARSIANDAAGSSRPHRVRRRW